MTTTNKHINKLFLAVLVNARVKYIYKIYLYIIILACCQTLLAGNLAFKGTVAPDYLGLKGEWLGR
jgi:hypothetical protein